MSQPSPSPSPAPQAQNGGVAASGPSKASRQSLGPSVRAPANLTPLSPRPGASAARPTSELLGSGSFQTPEGTHAAHPRLHPGTHPSAQSKPWTNGSKTCKITRRHSYVPARDQSAPACADPICFCASRRRWLLRLSMSTSRRS